jgi:AbrB family looped-hinge helix DNA binding protein
MTLAKSRITAQGQISVPAEVRRRLGAAPGSVLEWHADGERIVVRKSGQYESEDVQRALFPDGRPRRRSLRDLEAGVRRYIRDRHARR